MRGTSTGMLRGAGAAALVLILLVTVAPRPVAAGGDAPVCAQPDVRVNSDTGVPLWQWNPSIALGDDGAVNALWTDPRDEPSGANSAYFARSTDGGKTWSDPDVRVNPFSPAHQGGPRIVAGPEGLLYAVWRGGSNRTIDVWVASSLDGGATWSAPSKVNDVSGFVQVSQSYGPSIAMDLVGTLYVAWEDWRNSLPDNIDPVIGNPDIYVARSTDAGVTWGRNVRVNDDPGTAEQRGVPALAVDPQGAVYVAWEDHRSDPQFPDVYLARSEDGGLTWSPNVRVNDVVSGWQGDPAIAADPSGVNVAWYDSRNGQGDVYFARSGDGGDTWGGSVRLNRHDGNGAGAVPAISAWSGGVFVAWQDGGRGVVLTWSTDRGQTWAPDAAVSSGNATQTDPSLAVGPPGIAYLAWVDERNGDTDIYFTSCRVQMPSAVTLAAIHPPVPWPGVIALTVLPIPIAFGVVIHRRRSS